MVGKESAKQSKKTKMHPVEEVKATAMDDPLYFGNKPSSFGDFGLMQSFSLPSNMEPAI